MTLPNYLFIFGAKYLFVLAGIIAVIWFWKLPNEKKKETVVFGIIALPLIYIVAKIGSGLYFNPRPFVVGHFTPLIPHDLDNGFPSDHVLLISAIASVIFPFSKKVSTYIWIVAILVGISRVYVGIHHPIDVIGSAVISIMISTLVYEVLKRFCKKRTLIPAK